MILKTVCAAQQLNGLEGKKDGGQTGVNLERKKKGFRFEKGGGPSKRVEAWHTEGLRKEERRAHVNVLRK